MITITVRFMSIARLRSGISVVKFSLHESKLRDALEQIADRYGIRDIIFAENGDVRPWARVLVNGRSHDFVGGLDAELHDGDNVAIIYPYSENF